jgi:hypothetical protein
MNEVVNPTNLDIVELGKVSQETKGVFYPSSFECATQAVDARDE